MRVEKMRKIYERHRMLQQVRNMATFMVMHVHTLTATSSIYSVGFKKIVILVVEYSFSFQMNSPNILLIL